MKRNVDGSCEVAGRAAWTFVATSRCRGWAKQPLGLPYEDDHALNPSGIYRLDGKGGVKLRGNEAEGKEWLPQFLGPLFESLSRFSR